MRIMIFVFYFLIGCIRQPQDEIDTFSAGDREYILYLQSKIMQDQDNNELWDKMHIAVREARNRRDQKNAEERRSWEMQNTIDDLKYRMPAKF